MISIFFEQAKGKELRAKGAFYNACGNGSNVPRPTSLSIAKGNWLGAKGEGLRAHSIMPAAMAATSPAPRPTPLSIAKGNWLRANSEGLSAFYNACGNGSNVPRPTSHVPIYSKELREHSSRSETKQQTTNYLTNNFHSFVNLIIFQSEDNYQD